MAKKDPKPQFTDNGELKAESLEAIKEWDADDFDGLTKFIMQAWDQAGVLSRSSRKLAMTMASPRHTQIFEALQGNVEWWGAHWYMSQRGDKHEFRDRP